MPSSRMTAEEIIIAVVEFLDQSIRGSGTRAIGQPPYRDDLFSLFSEAYRNGYMVRGSSYHLSADSLRAYIMARWENGTQEQRDKLTDEACTMWQEWRYAWDRHPHSPE